MTGVQTCALPISQATAQTTQYINNHGDSPAIEVKEPNDSIPQGITGLMSGHGYPVDNSVYYITPACNSNYRLNVNEDGINMDYEGIRVSVWESTTDISQKFRMEKTGECTYRIWAVCSKAGYGRVLGIDDNGDLGLYSSTSEHACEFRLDYYDSSSFILTPSDSDLGRLSISDEISNDSSVSVSFDGSYSWNFQSTNVTNSSGLESALYPANDVLITQAPYEEYSHAGQNAVDLQSSSRIFAPYTGIVISIDYNYNAVWLESLNKVLYADGTINYMTMVFMHDDDISDIYIGQIISQGEYFYDMGTAGGAEGSHVHISCFDGKYDSASMTLYANTDSTVYITDALFLTEKSRIVDDAWLNWVYIG